MSFGLLFSLLPVLLRSPFVYLSFTFRLPTVLHFSVSFLSSFLPLLFPFFVDSFLSRILCGRQLNVYLRVFTCIYVYLRVLTCIYVYLRVLTCIYVYLRVLTCIYVYLRVLKLMWKNAPIYVYSNEYVYLWRREHMKTNRSNSV